uniref:Uncharacterized protein n=1 Tax=Oryza punctata TaxID=4537 RepID=A0A0E0M3Z8_ORYPU
MKTLRRETRREPEEAKRPEPEEKEAAAWPAGWSFTPRELDAAEQLVLLSGSSTSTTGTTPSAAGSAASGSSSASSSRSVNAPPPTPAPLPRATESTLVVQEERHEHPEEDWEQRPGRRFRLIAEIYAVTEEIE